MCLTTVGRDWLGRSGCKPNEELSADDVISHCLKQLAKFKVPASVEFIDALPRNGTGKVLKRTLRDQYVDASQPAIT